MSSPYPAFVVASAVFNVLSNVVCSAISFRRLFVHHQREPLRFSSKDFQNATNLKNVIGCIITLAMVIATFAIGRLSASFNVLNELTIMCSILIYTNIYMEFVTLTISSAYKIYHLNSTLETRKLRVIGFLLGAVANVSYVSSVAACGALGKQRLRAVGVASLSLQFLFGAISLFVAGKTIRNKSGSSGKSKTFLKRNLMLFSFTFVVLAYIGYRTAGYATSTLEMCTSLADTPNALYLLLSACFPIVGIYVSRKSSKIAPKSRNFKSSQVSVSGDQKLRIKSQTAQTYEHRSPIEKE